MTKRRFAQLLLVVSVIGWPISAFLTWDKEPQFVLALSWIAIILTALDAFWTAEVEQKQDETEIKRDAIEVKRDDIEAKRDRAQDE